MSDKCTTHPELDKTQCEQPAQLILRFVDEVCSELGPRKKYSTALRVLDAVGVDKPEEEPAISGHIYFRYWQWL